MIDEQRTHRDSPAFFFTVPLDQDGSQLLTDQIDRLRRAVGQALAARPVTVLGWTVLPDRMHAVWRMDWDDDFAGRWTAIQRSFEQCLRDAGLSVPVPLWRDQIVSVPLRDDEQLAAHMEFCREAPVLAGLSGSAEEWAFSSFRKHRAEAVTSRV